MLRTEETRTSPRRLAPWPRRIAAGALAIGLPLLRAARGGGSGATSSLAISVA